MLTTRVKIEIAAAILAILAVAIIGGSWLGAREEGIRLKATLDAQNGVIADAGRREAERASALKDSLAQLESLKKNTQTPAQVIQGLPQVLPLPQPITLSLPPGILHGEANKGDLPAAPTAQIPAADLKPLYDFAVTCKECQAKVAVLQQDKVDDAVKISALTKERDEAVTAAKGGRKWQRIKRAAKWLVIGVGVGAAAGAIARR